MAVKATYSWVKGVWDSINYYIRNFSNGLSQLSNPGYNITKSDFDRLDAKIAEIKRDYYLSHEAGLFVTSAVIQGQLINENFYNSTNNWINGLKVIVCKNIVANQNGTNSLGTNSHGSNSNGDNGYGSNGYGQTRNSRGSYSSDKTAKIGHSHNGNGMKSNGSNSNGVHSSNGVCTANGVCTNITYIDLRNSKTTSG